MNEAQALVHWAQNRGQSAEVDAANWLLVEQAREAAQEAQQAPQKKAKAQPNA